MTASGVERMQRRPALGDRWLVQPSSCALEDPDCLVRAGREQGATLVVQAEVMPRAGSGGKRDYEVAVAAVAFGRVVRRIQQRCGGCDEAALEDRVAEAVGALLEETPVHAHPLPPEPAARPAPPADGLAAIPPQRDEGRPLPRPPQGRALQIAGAVLLPVGAGLALGGLLLQVGHHLGWGQMNWASSPLLCMPGTSMGQWCLEPWVGPVLSGAGFWLAGGGGGILLRLGSRRPRPGGMPGDLARGSR